jgi:hypothetical protein
LDRDRTLATMRRLPRLITAVRPFALTTVISALVVTLTGCVSTLDVKSTNTDLKSASSYLASKGVTNAQDRIEAQLAESSQKRRERVFWGGVAVAGGNEDPEKNLPLCANAGLLHEFEESIGEKLRAVNPALFDLQNTGAGPARADNWKNQDALVMMLVLVSENRLCQPDSGTVGNYRAGIQVMGQLLFFDTSQNMQVTASYPLGVVQGGFYSTVPSDAEFAALAKDALLSADRTAEGKALSLRDQFLDQLAGRTLVPRAWRAPVAVGAVSFAVTCQKASVPGGTRELPETLLSRWSQQFASAFVNYLGTGSGLAVNPYTAGGELAVAKDRTLSAAATLTMRTTDRKMHNASLKPPRMLFNLQIASLSCAVSDLSTRFKTILNYGFCGELTVVNPDTGATLLSLPLQIPVSKDTQLPRQLSEKYAKIAAVTPPKAIADRGEVDHVFWWQDLVDRSLTQLAREIAFEEEDLAHRFSSVREELRRSLNAGLSRPMEVVSGNHAL